jgi:hypothetical protein
MLQPPQIIDLDLYRSERRTNASAAQDKMSPMACWVPCWIWTMPMLPVPAGWNA